MSKCQRQDRGLLGWWEESDSLVNHKRARDLELFPDPCVGSRQCEEEQDKSWG